MISDGSSGLNLLSDGAPRGLVIAVSAPSGTGKTTLCNMLLKEFADIKPSISYTTRLKREGEIDGVSYHFISDGEFDKMAADNEFIEWVNLIDKKYGTAYKSIYDNNIERLHDILLEIDVQGVEKLIKYYDVQGEPDKLITIFIKPPSHKDLIDRLKKRGGMSDEELKKRSELAFVEMKKSTMYDYIITNDELNEAYSKLRSIIIAERCKNLHNFSQ